MELKHSSSRRWIDREGKVGTPSGFGAHVRNWGKVTALTATRATKAQLLGERNYPRVLGFHIIACELADPLPCFRRSSKQSSYGCLRSAPPMGVVAESMG